MQINADQYGSIDKTAILLCRIFPNLHASYAASRARLGASILYPLLSA